MIFSLLPANALNVFGSPVAANNLNLPLNISGPQRAQLYAGTAHIELLFRGAGFASGATAASITANIGGTLAAAGANVGTIVGGASFINVVSNGSILTVSDVIPVLTYDSSVVLGFEDAVSEIVAPAVAGTSLSALTVGQFWVSLTNLEITSSTVQGFFVDYTTGTAVPLTELVPLTPVSGPGTGALTIQAGVVRNPYSEASNVGRPVEVTVNIDQLHTHLSEPTARLNFQLHGPSSGGEWVRFVGHTYTSLGGESFFQLGGRDIQVNNAGNIRSRDSLAFGVNTTNTGGWTTGWRTPLEAQNGTHADHPVPIPGLVAHMSTSAWTPTIRIHPDSQVFHVTDTNNPIPNGHLLFTAGTPGSPLQLGQLGTVGADFNGQSLDGWLSLSATGVSETGFTHNINQLTGVLVLEIVGVAANAADSRITVRRLGRIAQETQPGDTGVVLVNNQQIVHGVAGFGVTFSVQNVRYFSSGLVIDELIIRETRPTSLNRPWFGNLDALAGTETLGGNIQQVRLVGPRDFVWNVGPDTGQGLQPVEGFTVTANGAFQPPTAPFVQNDSFSHFLDPATGRPVLIFNLNVPARAAHPAQYAIGELRLHGLTLVPTRDVPHGEIRIEAGFGHWGGGLITTNLIPMPIQEFVLTAEEIQRLTVLGINTPAQPNNQAVANALDAVDVAGRIGALPGFDNFDARLAEYRAFDQAALDDPLNALFINNVRKVISVRWMPIGGTQEIAAQWTERGTGTAWVNRNLLVGHLIDSALQLRIRPAETELPTLVSGQRTFPNPAANVGIFAGNPWDNNATNNAVAGTRTATVEIHELVPGALNSNWMNSVVEFNIAPTEGVQIVNAAWRMHVAYAPHAAGMTTTWQPITVTDADDLQAVTAQAVSSANRESVRLFVPRRAEQGNVANELRALRTLQIVFWVSTIAGYEQLIGDDITVTVSGNAVQDLPATNRSLEIAHVIDPITVELDGPLTQMEVGQVMSPFEITPISDIIITETAEGRFERGTQLMVSLEALPITVLGNHALVSTQATVVNPESGLELRVVETGAAGGLGNAYILLEVVRPSINGPATIRLSNNHVMGTFLPGISYGISVNAIPVATTAGPGSPFTSAAGSIGRNPIAQNTARGLTGRGLFNAVPYFTPVIEFGSFVYEGLPPGVGVPGPGTGITPGQNLRFWEGMSAMPTNVGGEFHLVQDPFTFVYTTPDLRVAMLNPRVFADIIGGELTYGGTPMQITFNGPSAMGDNVTVTLTVGSTQAVVNGVTVDIAAFAGASGPAGSISTQIINDRSFVPLRFLATAFGYVVDASGFPVIELR